MKKTALLGTLFAFCLTFAALGSYRGPFDPPSGDPANYISNFSLAAPGVFRGARPSKQGMVALANLGIRSVVNLQGGDREFTFTSWFTGKIHPGERIESIEGEGAFARSLGLQYYSSPLSSRKHVSVETDLQIDDILEFIGNPDNQPVFIHCDYGKDRTGLLVALYHVKYFGMNAEAAHQDMVQNGHGAYNRIFTSNLDHYFYRKAKTLAAEFN